MGTAAERIYARLAPVAFDDAANGYTVRSLADAIATSRQTIDDLVRDSPQGHIGWGILLDPDYCPSALLDWLAVFAGVTLPPRALTDVEKRARIKAAAGQYRGTPRAIIEEMQTVLTGTKTVYFASRDPDFWHYTVGTKASETPSASAADAALAISEPAGFLGTRFATTTWSYLELGASQVGTRTTVDGVDTYTITAGAYPTYADVIAHFTTYADLAANTPH